jgi:hypothetical protein
VVACILRRYPQFTLDHIFRRGYREGGLTYLQVFFFYEDYQKERLNEFKALGSLLGAKFDDDKKIDKSSPSQKEDQSFEFKDPGEYKNLSEDERSKLTEKMMNQHKKQMSGSIKSMES